MEGQAGSYFTSDVPTTSHNCNARLDISNIQPDGIKELRAKFDDEPQFEGELCIRQHNFLTVVHEIIHSPFKVMTCSLFELRD